MKTIINKEIEQISGGYPEFQRMMELCKKHPGYKGCADFEGWKEKHMAPLAEKHANQTNPHQ